VKFVVFLSIDRTIESDWH